MTSSTEIAVSPMVSLSSQLAPMAAIVVFMAPLPTIQNIRRDKTVGNLPLLPYTSMISSSFLWMVYGLLLSNAQLVVPNFVGFLLGLYYVTSFIPYAPSSAPTLPGSVKLHVQVVATMGFLTILLAVSPLPITIVGNLGVVVCMIMFASPLAALQTVVRTRSAAAIPLPFTVASTTNCFLWSVSGWFDLKDPNVYVPNLVALAFSLLQIVLKLYYGNGPPKSELPA